MSATGFHLPSPGLGRAPLREKLEQGVFGVAFAAFGLCLIESLGARRVYLMTDGNTGPLLKLFSAPWSANLESR